MRTECETCGGSLYPAGTPTYYMSWTRRFCSPACKQKAYRTRSKPVPVVCQTCGQVVGHQLQAQLRSRGVTVTAGKTLVDVLVTPSAVTAPARRPRRKS
jgi:hypothetical protein